MARLRTKVDFVAALDEEFAWRLKEIDDLKKSIRDAMSLHQRALLRAGIALLYAHWEGFVKSAAEIYLNYLAHKRIPYQELKLCFIVLGFKGHLSTLETSDKAEPTMSAMQFILDNVSKNSRLPFKGIVETESNLSSTVFQNIAELIGISSEPYMVYSQLIDSSLLSRRNKVAHGEIIELENKDYNELTGEVIKLLRFFITDLENSVINELYLIANS